MIELTHFSVVVLAQTHNPTILNPDFLKNTGIIAGEYRIKNSICTPPVAQVVYEEGISVIAEFEKIQFIDDLSERLPSESPIPQIAVKYINTLPYVKYTAAGINFAGHRLYSDYESVRAFMRNRFVKDGPWMNSENETVDIGLNFVYKAGDVKRNISINPGEYRKTEKSSGPIVVLRYNHHLEVQPNDTEAISKFILGWENAFKQYIEFSEHIFRET